MDLKEARMAANLTQQQVADHLGVSRPTYIKMEKDPDSVSVVDAKHLAGLFNCKVNDIFFGRNYS